jgi:hypothetical protein
MKRVLAIVLGLCLLSGLSVNADIDTIEGSTIAGGGGCTTPTTGDIFNEGFIGGFENTECGSDPCIESIGTVTTNYSLTNSPPAGSCSNGAYVDASNSQDYVQWSEASPIDVDTTPVVIFAEVNIKSVSLDNFAAATILNGGAVVDNPGSSVGRIEIYNNNSTYQFRGKGTTTATTATFSLNTWYTLTIYLHTTAASSYWTVDEIAACDAASECTFTRAAVDPEFFHVGAAFGLGATPETIEMEIGRWYVNTP